MRLTMHDGTTLHTTTHADLRWLERGGPVETMAREMEAAVQYGAQFGDQQLWLTPCGLVLVAKADGIVATVLTQAQAIGNMQMYGLFPKSLPGAPTLPSLPMKEPRAPSVDECSEVPQPIYMVAVEEVLASPQSSATRLTRVVAERLVCMGKIVTDQDRQYITHAIKGAKFMYERMKQMELASVEASA